MFKFVTWVLTFTAFLLAILFLISANYLQALTLLLAGLIVTPNNQTATEMTQVRFYNKHLINDTPEVSARELRNFIVAVGIIVASFYIR
ncbi:hypothetical protein ACSLBF_10180 [Pseudoalteromonas sp. T1lg65]|uniref:hypothetical protein n=1 Tax=Pseudoalteromonas sp. T1lg65 TaxID=2077101 RepID=UPI003F7AEC63